MSASREKQLRQDQVNSDQVETKVAQEEQQAKKQKRSNTLYAVIGVVFLLAVIGSIIWRSNIITKNAAAITIDGEKYTAAEVNFYYQNTYQGFLNDYYYFFSYFGIDASSPLKGQVVNETAASWLGLEEGQDWHDYIMDQTLMQMTVIQNGLKQAEAEGFVYPASVQTQYEDAVAALDASASANGVSSDQYVKSILGSLMTKDIYTQQLLRLLKIEAYTSAFEDGLSYSAADINAAYAADPNSYDEVAYESARISGVAESVTDADGNTVAPSEEENLTAMEAAITAAEALHADYLVKGDLKALAEANAAFTYTVNDGISYAGDVLTEWLFDEARKEGDSTVLESGSTYYVVVFHERLRKEDPTIDVRHILIQPEAGTLAEGEEGYDAEQKQLMADAMAKATDVLAQWKAGDATEDSFAQLAMEHSVDGSKYDGGLYTAVYPNQMVAEFNDWCFDSRRKAGDTDVVETEFGAHVMYFVGDNLPYWQTMVVSDLKNAEYTELLTSLSTSNEVSEGFGIKFVG